MAQVGLVSRAHLGLVALVGSGLAHIVRFCKWPDKVLTYLELTISLAAAVVQLQAVRRLSAVRAVAAGRALLVLQILAAAVAAAEVLRLQPLGVLGLLSYAT